MANEQEEWMSANVTPEKGEIFEEVLEAIKENGGWTPTGKAYTLAQAIWPWAAMELVVLPDPRNPKALLARYRGAGIPEHQNRYHIPGGFGFKKGEPMVKNINEWCTRVAMDELGVDVEVLGTLGFHFWTPDEHPTDGRLVSQYVAVRPLGDIVTSDELRFFTRNEILALGPEDMVQNHPHRRFLDQYLGALEAGTPAEPLKFGL